MQTLSRRVVKPLEPAADVLAKIRDPHNDEYSNPTLDHVRSVGQLSEDEQEAFLTLASAAGAKDVEENLLQPPAEDLSNLESLLRKLDQRFEAIAGNGADMIENHLDLAQSVLETEAQQLESGHVSDDATDHPATLLEQASYDLAVANADVAEFQDRGKRTRWFAALLLVGAVLGVFIDSAIFGTVIQNMEQYTDTVANLMGFVLTLVLAGFAATAGWLAGKGSRPGAVPDPDVPKSLNDQHGKRVASANKRARNNMIKSIVIVVGLLVILALLFLARIMTMFNSDVETSGGKLLQVGIMVLAVLSVYIFWAEAHSLTLHNRYKKALEARDAAQTELDKLGDRPAQASAFRAQMSRNEADMTEVKIRERVDWAIEGILPMFPRTIQAYVRGGETALTKLPAGDGRITQREVLPTVAQRLGPIEAYQSVQIHEAVARQEARRAAERRAAAGGA